MTNTILLADDSVTIQKVIELTFMDEDYEVVAVGNGDEALDQLEELTPDVVIADVHMPGASGYDVARRAKQLHPQAPVLLLVGTFEPFDDDDYQSCGADDYLKKPFDSQELLQRVSDLMAARAGMDHAPATPTDEAAAGERSDAPAGQPPTPAGEPAGGGEPAGTGEPVGVGDETRFVPTWEEPEEPEEPESGGWRPGDEAGEDGGLGTRRMPTFGAPAEAAGESETSASWDLVGEPEEIVPTVEPVEDREPEWAGGEPFESTRDNLEAGGAADEAASEPPSWALEETGDAPSAESPETLAATAESWAPPSSAVADVPPPPAAERPAAAGRGHHGEPFPELTARPPAAGASGATAGRSESPTPVGEEGRLSSGDVDRVARRVIELLGDEVLREVAWEVVPDLAEVVIKDRLRELESQVD